MAVIDLGTPESNQEGYTKVRVDDIHIFMPDKMAEESKEVEISLSRLLKWKKLMLEKY